MRLTSQSENKSAKEKHIMSIEFLGLLNSEDGQKPLSQSPRREDIHLTRHRYVQSSKTILGLLLVYGCDKIKVADTNGVKKLCDEL